MFTIHSHAANSVWGAGAGGRGSGSGSGAPCRLCLAPGGAGALFPAHHAPARYARALRLATGLAIELDDGLPQSICRNCVALVNSALKLRKQSHHAQKILLKTGFQKTAMPFGEFEYKPCDTDPQGQIHAADEKVTENKNDVENTLSNDLYIEIDNYTEILESTCSAKEKIKNKTKIVKQSHENYTDSEIDADLYGENDEPFIESDKITNINEKRQKRQVKESKSSNTKDRVKRKYVKKADKLALEPVDKIRKINRLTKQERQEQYLCLVEGPYDPRGPVQCKICKKVLARISNFISHTKRHFKGEFVCDQCGKTFHTKHSLSTHGMRMHGDERTIRCPLCDFRAVDQYQLKNHTARQHTGAREFVCDVCGADFYCKANVRQHMRRHFAPKTVQCDRCPAMFNSRSSLASHTAKSHRLNFAYLCYACPRRYTGRCAVRSHLARQHGLPRPQQGPVRVIKWRKGEPPPADLE